MSNNNSVPMSGNETTMSKGQMENKGMKERDIVPLEGKIIEETKIVP